MSPIASSSRGAGQGEGDDLWASLLSSLHTRSTRGNKYIVMLGTPKSGKSSLLAKMGDSDRSVQSNPGIEFSYLTMRDEERERIGLLGVHSTSYKHFLPHVITRDRLANTLVVINLPMDNPWNLDDDLFYWTSLLDRHIKQLGIEEDEMAQLRQNVVDIFTSYKAPKSGNEDGEANHGDGLIVETDYDSEEKIVLPIPAETLTHNLGVPVIFVLNKVDAMSTLQKDHDFTEEYFEFIQWHLRSVCLSYGAGLLYCSPRENSNTKLLLDYISHIFYDTKFSSEAQVVDKDAIFVPIGWDSPAKIALVSDGFINFTENKPYADQIKPLPDVRKKKQTKGEDDQTFLTRMQGVLAERIKEGGGGSSPIKLEVSPKGGAAPANAPPPATDTVLSNFFNSLLTKKPGNPTSPNSTSPAQTRKTSTSSTTAPRQLSEVKKEKLAASQSNPEQGDRLELPVSREPGLRSSTLPRGLGGARDKSPAVRRTSGRGIPRSNIKK